MTPDHSTADSTGKSSAETSETEPSKTENPVETLQRRYADQLSQDIEQLEAEKIRLKAEILSLRQDYATLHQQTRQLRAVNNLSERPVNRPRLTDDPEPVSATEKLPTLIGPRLPGEPSVVPANPNISEPIESATRDSSAETISSSEGPDLQKPDLRGPELPMPATSERRRQQVMQRQKDSASQSSATISVRRRSYRKGLILSAIATLFISMQYGLVDVISQGGSWLGLSFGQLGVGFVPAVALLWLRMLVIVPVLVLIAPQLYLRTWEDMQDWLYNQEYLLIQLIASGVALFFSQVLLYQSIGVVGPAVSAALLFLYPLTAIPVGLFLKQERVLSPFGLMALVALAMGGALVAQPIATLSLSSLSWGLLASLALSFYIVLTNLSYRQQCHPIPVAVVQFSTVAALSSLVLLVKPLQLASITWVGLFWWGVLIGVLMLLAYFLNYSSLRSIGPRTAMVAAATPLVVLLCTWNLMPVRWQGHSPGVSLEIIQLTGILLVSIGGIALGKEKLSRPS